MLKLVSFFRSWIVFKCFILKYIFEPESSRHSHRYHQSLLFFSHSPKHVVCSWNWKSPNRKFCIGHFRRKFERSCQNKPIHPEATACKHIGFDILRELMCIITDYDPHEESTRNKLNAIIIPLIKYSCNFDQFYCEINVRFPAFLQLKYIQSC